MDYHALLDQPPPGHTGIGRACSIKVIQGPRLFCAMFRTGHAFIASLFLSFLFLSRCNLVGAKAISPSLAAFVPAIVSESSQKEDQIS